MKPRIFIASSTEGLKYAQELEKLLSSNHDCNLWTKNIFHLSSSTLEALCNAAHEFDFGVSVFSPDDLAVIRGKRLQTARDNVIFELGLFMGALGQKRGFFVVPTGLKSFRIPTDLTGITYARYDPTTFQTNSAQTFVLAANEISNSIKANQHFHRCLDIDVQAGSCSNFPLAINIVFSNRSNSPAVIKLEGFSPSGQLPFFPSAKMNISTNRFELKFPTFSNPITPIYDSLAASIEINASISTFFPIDQSKINISQLRTMIQRKMNGKIQFSCVWLEPTPLVKKYVFDI